MHAGFKDTAKWVQDLVRDLLLCSIGFFFLLPLWLHLFKNNEVAFLWASLYMQFVLLFFLFYPALLCQCCSSGTGSNLPF